MTPQEINITYNPQGDITFTVTWHPVSLDDALAAVREFVARLGGETKPKQEPKPKAAPKPKQTKPMSNKRGRHLWTDDEKREAMEMWANGVDVDIIAKKFNSTPGSVQKIMTENKVRRPWPTRGNPSGLKVETQEEKPDEPV